ncbi:hypothetical protein ACFQ0M_04100 [Kitasatospora aburaviensis]
MRHGQEQSRLELASTVADIRFANDGTMAAIDDGGKILVRPPRAARRTSASRRSAPGCSGSARPVRWCTSRAAP